MENNKQLRYVAYIRTSSEDQVGNFSIDAQKHAIENWINSKDGKLVDFYIDEAQSGHTIDRPEFLRMRRDAKQGLFHAIVVHKFDRLARNHSDALAIKSLLRHQYGIKVFSVSEPSEDSDGSMGLIIEGIMESVADWYSQNLAAETVKGKREKARQGYHNNLAPFGMDKTKDGILIPNEEELKGLRLAFDLYSTGGYSDNGIARELNTRGFRSKTGRRFSTDTVRDILQNRTYLGFVKYQPYQRGENGKRSYKGEIEWFVGKHDSVIPDDLFEQCQTVRKRRASKRQSLSTPQKRVYLLSDLIYCAECVENMPDNITDSSYGKMRAQSNNSYYYYRCRAHDFGRQCSQLAVKALDVEEQVIHFLKNLHLPDEKRQEMVKVMAEQLGDKNVQERVSEIKEIIKRMDFRWDSGFIMDKDEYLEKREQLQQELEKLSPIPDDALERAADLIENFTSRWKEIEDDRDAQKELIHLIVSKVWVRDDRVTIILVRPNFHFDL